jgi:hypothetical protein
MGESTSLGSPLLGDGKKRRRACPLYTPHADLRRGGFQTRLQDHEGMERNAEGRGPSAHPLGDCVGLHCDAPRITLDSTRRSKAPSGCPLSVIPAGFSYS